MLPLALKTPVSVATVLTVYGIETSPYTSIEIDDTNQRLQQYLPFTVLKPTNSTLPDFKLASAVATVLTVYGIETFHTISVSKSFMRVATVLTVYGIET